MHGGEEDDAAPSSSTSASVKRRFRAGGAIDGENRSDGMSNGTTESIFAIGQMKENRGIASLNFSQAFTAKKEAGGGRREKHNRLFYVFADKYNLKREGSLRDQL